MEINWCRNSICQSFCHLNVNKSLSMTPCQKQIKHKVSIKLHEMLMQGCSKPSRWLITKKINYCHTHLCWTYLCQSHLCRTLLCQVLLCQTLLCQTLLCRTHPWKMRGFQSVHRFCRIATQQQHLGHDCCRPLHCVGVRVHCVHSLIFVQTLKMNIWTILQLLWPKTKYHRHGYVTNEQKWWTEQNKWIDCMLLCYFQIPYKRLKDIVSIHQPRFVFFFCNSLLFSLE